MTKTTEKVNSFKCQLLTCNCENTIPLDATKLAKDLALPDTPEIYSNLCRMQIDKFEEQFTNSSGSKLIVACTQEAPLFEELADELNADMEEPVEISFVNIREQAGWGSAGQKAGAKIAALIAEASYEVQPTGLIPVTSQGNCLVYGAGQQAMDVAKKMAGHLNISLVLTDAIGVFPPDTTLFPVYKGKINGANGSIGKFTISLSDYSAVSPSSKTELKFLAGRDNVATEMDLIFDLSGQSPLFGTSHTRDGYIRVDPSQKTAIAEAMFEITDLVGEFEKPIFVSYDKAVCAHSRSGQTGCSNCIDNCPTSAISSNGDSIVVNNEICDGCGHCSSSCPTSAISYAFPKRTDLIGRSQVLVSTYLNSGGVSPVLLIHENQHGDGIISAIARFSDGLDDNVLPFSVHSITQIGHDILCGFFTTGLQSIVLLVPAKKSRELDALSFQVELTNTFLENMGFDENIRVRLLVEDDPDLVVECLSSIPRTTTVPVRNFVASTSKREMARIAIGNLNTVAPKKLELLELPLASPYGAVSIDTTKCTLCLACVGSCPANALGDNEDRPQVSFTEHACVQCGLCKTTCPENAITLQPQYNFNKSALSPVILNHEEPLECSECGKPFGSKSAIEKVISILQGKNPMFQTSQQLAMLKMCENCRVTAMTEAAKDPMTFGTVPKTLTAADILPEDEEPTRH